MKLYYFIFLSLSLALPQVRAANDTQDPPPLAPVKTSADNSSPDPTLFRTDISAIELVALNIDQTSSVDPEARPNQKPAATEVTAVDGELTSQRRSLAVSEKRSPAPQVWEIRFNKGNIVKAEERAASDYIKVFDASTSSRDASIQGTAYLTYKLVSNTTYSINDCLAFCDSVPQCRFANLYYEFNNALYDWVFSEKSNLACALYGDVHTAAEKTNFAGQQLKPEPEPLTSITRSTGWAKEAPYTPPTPSGYSLSFGPISRSNNQGFSLGFHTLSNYDVAACASICNSRVADPILGSCQSFNIFRVLVERLPTTYVCQLYGVAIDASTAGYSGNGNLEVTLSRGYNRINTLPNRITFDGGSSHPTSEWQITGGYAAGFTSFGHSNAGSFFNGYIAFNSIYNPPSPLQPASMKNRFPIQTISGKRYTLQLWYYQEASQNELGIKWNGANIYYNQNLPRSLTFGVWTPLSFTVTAQGNDQLEIFGGGYLEYQYISDVSLSLYP